MGRPSVLPRKPFFGRLPHRGVVRPLHDLGRHADGLCDPQERHRVLKPVVAAPRAVVALLPGVRPDAGRRVRCEPRDHVLAFVPSRLARRVVRAGNIPVRHGVMSLAPPQERRHPPAAHVVRVHASLFPCEIARAHYPASVRACFVSRAANSAILHERLFVLYR